jgi:LysR family hydrogen peroxide-inducible transcriptional activator
MRLIDSDQPQPQCCLGTNPDARVARAVGENSGMTLTELKYIVAVARERHFGKAAEACFVSQPTLSVAVKKLEEELDVK